MIVIAKSVGQKKIHTLLLVANQIPHGTFWALNENEMKMKTKF